LAKRTAEAHLHRVAAPAAIRDQGREFEMRDELDGRMWADHHEAYADWVDGAIAAVRGAIGRFAAWDGSTHQLLALVAAFALTALNISFSSSAA
jgi:hypothetical protein